MSYAKILRGAARAVNLKPGQLGYTVLKSAIQEAAAEALRPEGKLGTAYLLTGSASYLAVPTDHVEHWAVAIFLNRNVALQRLDALNEAKALWRRAKHDIKLRDGVRAEVWLREKKEEVGDPRFSDEANYEITPIPLVLKGRPKPPPKCPAVHVNGWRCVLPKGHKGACKHRGPVYRRVFKGAK